MKPESLMGETLAEKPCNTAPLAQRQCRTANTGIARCGAMRFKVRMLPGHFAPSDAHTGIGQRLFLAPACLFVVLATAQPLEGHHFRGHQLSARTRPGGRSASRFARCASCSVSIDHPDVNSSSIKSSAVCSKHMGFAAATDDQARSGASGGRFLQVLGRDCGHCRPVGV